MTQRPLHRRRLSALFCLGLLAACGDDPTGIEITVEYDPSWNLDQLRVAGRVDGELVAIPGTIPDRPRALTSGRDTVVIGVAPDLAGKRLDLEVEGLAADVAVAGGQGSATIRLHQVVRVSVTLATCDASSCPDGCCDGFACTTGSLATCGDGGDACTPCDTERADACTDGECRCGSQPACEAGQLCDGGACVTLCDASSCANGCCDGVTCMAWSAVTCGGAGSQCLECPAQVSDNCTDGECRCGDNPACGVGQRCVGGLCFCDSVSCDGCCDGTTCLQGQSNVACGSAGQTCADCTTTGDTCSGGACSGCDDVSCPNGCCSGATCFGRALETCGTGGEVCSPCDPVTADRCAASGTCRCGSNPPCEAGQRCSGGVCVCDGESCSGCCDGLTCLDGTGDAACGIAGADCEDCSAGGNTCSGGVCSGGDCDASTCSNGCCSGATCHPRDVDTCGVGGAGCTACDPIRADNCSVQGVCRCGTLAQCPVGKMCDGGACVCDPAECPGCCSGANCLLGTTNNACGQGGETCDNCQMMGQVCQDDGTCN